MKRPLRLHFLIRDLVYPGLDLHTRSRASLCCFWNTGPRRVLDAGSGNGYFSWLAYQSGAHVTGLNFDCHQTEKAHSYFLEHRRADPTRLHFEQFNLYDLGQKAPQFDEIICYEVLEHLRRDYEVVEHFYRLLAPNGVLHICCPNREHPRHQAEVLDIAESGGHVRAGYTEHEYRKLLEPLGFHIERVVGIGTHSLYLADKLLRQIRERMGDLFAMPLLPFMLPCVWFARFDPPVPFSLYVKAVKPAN